MRPEFPGYYRPTPEEFDELWERAQFVLDANVLLNLYRFSVPAREQLLEVLMAIEDRLWVPHQAALEFQRGRVGVIDEQRNLYERVLDEIQKSKARILASVRRKSVMDQAQLSKELDDNLRPVMDHVKLLLANHPDPLEAGDWLGPDEVRDQLDQILASRVGPPLAQFDAKEAARRYEASIPPGYEDKSKPEPQRYGDLVLWLELLEHARTSMLPVVLVAGEQKADWWFFHPNKERGILGPRPELVKEMWDKAGVAFYMYGLEPFITEASKRFKVETSHETLQEAADLGAATVLLGSHGFSDEAWLNWIAQSYATIPLGNVQSASTTVYPTLANGYANAFVMDDEVILLFGPGVVRPQDDRVACVVKTPFGEASRAVRELADSGLAAARYPIDFDPLFVLQRGPYTVAWYDAPLVPTLEPSKLAETTFVVRDA